jgi:hypothetical protein
MIEIDCNKNPKSQGNWLELGALEALTRLASSPPSPTGRGYWKQLFDRFDAIWQIFSPTRFNQNSLLPQGGRRVGDEGGVRTRLFLCRTLKFVFEVAS